jgi:hypothetical protein
MQKGVLTLVVSGLVGAGCIGCDSSYMLNDAERATAELGARDFAERSGARYISCSGQDSDGDDYVTCSTSTNELACSYIESARGCKVK